MILFYICTVHKLVSIQTISFGIAEVLVYVRFI